MKSPFFLNFITKYVLSLQPLQDWILALGVGFLVLIDLVILVIYSLVEGLRGNLDATRIPNVERQQEISGVGLRHVYKMRN